MNTFNFLKRTLSIVFVITLATFMACHKHTEQPAVNVSGFTPTEGKAGDAITISGNNFSSTANNNVVDFNGTNATVTSATTTSLVLTVPQGATTGKISVAFEKSKGASADNFTVLMPATIASFAPASGIVGTVVTITGTNFSTTPTNNVVKFNGTAATVSAATATSLTVAVPTGATTGKITVVVNGTTATSATDFALIPPPSINSFMPVSGAVGTVVTITGSNFSATLANNIVKFNGIDAIVSAATSTSLTVGVPAGATTGKVSVTVNSVMSTSIDVFTVLTGPYAAYRLKEIDRANSGYITSYEYDANNRVLSETQYVTNLSGLIYKITYTYNDIGLLTNKVVFSKLSAIKYVDDKYDYSYDANGILLSVNISTVDADNQGQPQGVYTVEGSEEYSFQNGLISSVIQKDENNEVTSTNTYTYSNTPNGEMQIVIHLVPTQGQAIDNTTIYYNTIVDPTPIPDPNYGYHLIIKSSSSSLGANYSSNASYILDAMNRVNSITINYPGLNKTTTYNLIYEGKQ